MSRGTDDRRYRWAPVLFRPAIPLEPQHVEQQHVDPSTGALCILGFRRGRCPRSTPTTFCTDLACIHGIPSHRHGDAPGADYTRQRK